MKTLKEKVDAILATLEVNGMIHVTEEKEVITINKIYPIEERLTALAKFHGIYRPIDESQEKMDELFLSKIERYSRGMRRLELNDTLYIPPGTRVLGARVKDVVLYGVSCRELREKENFNRFVEWLLKEVFPAIRP